MEFHNLPVRVEAFIAKMDSAQNLDDIFKALLARIQELEFERFSYWLIWPPEGPIKPLCLTNYPDEWAQHYHDEGYIADDYVGRFSAKSVIPFLWQELISRISLTKRQRLVFMECADAGMSAGGTIPVHGPGSAKATFSVTGAMKDEEFKKLFADRRHEVQLIATYAHEKILSLNLHKPLAGMVSLTPRETEILTWIARGKSRWETGIILNIKEDTVRVHLEKVRDKLEASNTTNAIAKAMMNGLIFP